MSAKVCETCQMKKRGPRRATHTAEHIGVPSPVYLCERCAADMPGDWHVEPRKLVTEQERHNER